MKLAKCIIRERALHLQPNNCLNSKGHKIPQFSGVSKAQSPKPKMLKSTKVVINSSNVQFELSNHVSLSHELFLWHHLADKCAREKHFRAKQNLEQLWRNWYGEWYCERRKENLEKLWQRWHSQGSSLETQKQNGMLQSKVFSSSPSSSNVKIK